MKEDVQTSSWFFWQKRRYVVAILAFFGFLNLQSNRINLSVTIIDMTANKSHTDNNGTLIYKQEFDWDTKLQGHLLSSLFYGYMSTQIIGGWLAARVGGSRVFGIGVLISAVITVIVPPLTKLSVYLLFVLRVMEGLFQGMAFPSTHALWAQWAPRNERTTLISLAISGSFFGFAVTFPLASVLVDYLGWPSVFYVPGGFGILWYMIWFAVVRVSPEDDPYISASELEYITSTRGCSSNQKIVHPWKKFFTSAPVWAIVAAHTCDNWGFYTLLTELPAFLRDNFGYSLQESGVLSFLPYFLMTLAMIYTGRLGDWLRTKGKLTTTQVRKLYCCATYLIQAVLIIWVATIQDLTTKLVCLSIVIMLGGVSWSSFSANYVDIAPRHASILIGLANTIATLPGIVSPAITGYIVQHHDISEWQIVFYIVSAFYTFAGVFYGLFGSGEQQSWASDEGCISSNSKIKPSTVK